MSTYAERTGRVPDFRVAYRKLTTPVRFRQGLRSDVKFECDAGNKLVWEIWPEFEQQPGAPLPEDVEAPPAGTATMWVVIDDAGYWHELRMRLKVGSKGFLVAGSHQMAEIEILEILAPRAHV